MIQNYQKIHRASFMMDVENKDDFKAFENFVNEKFGDKRYMLKRENETECLAKYTFSSSDLKQFIQIGMIRILFYQHIKQRDEFVEQMINPNLN